jgi:hypothetical protein
MSSNKLSSRNPVLISLNNEVFEIYSPLIYFYIAKTKKNLHIILSGLLGEDDDYLDTITFKYDYDVLAKRYGKTKGEILNSDVRFDKNITKPYKEIPNELIAVNAYDKKLSKSTNGVISIEKLIESILDYSFK